MTIEQLKNKNINDDLRAVIISKAYSLNERYGTPISTGLRVTYNAYGADYSELFRY